MANLRAIGMMLIGLIVTTGAAAQSGIAINPDNPRYWMLDGEPVVLVGGSVEDNLFQVDDPAAELDRLVAAGGNYVRNTMSSRDDGNLWPFRQGYAVWGRPLESLSLWGRAEDRLRAWWHDADGVYPRYDLNAFNDDYWRRFESFLELARERGVVVQIEVWDRFDYTRDPWLENPYNPMNNVNYSAGESGLLTAYPEHPGRNRSHFFRSVPELLMNDVLLPYQQAHMDRLLAISLRYDNVLYTISNETSGDAPWSAYWARYIRQRADEAGVRVHITEMWDPWDLSHPMHARTFNAPELYDFVDVSQNNHQTGQAHWDNLHRQWLRLADSPRPMNNVKIYGADGGRFGSSDEAVDRFWRSLLGGAASVRFHRPQESLGLGLGELAESQIRSAAVLREAVDLTRLQPRLDLLEQRDGNEAYLAAEPGRHYLLFFPEGGDVALTVPGTGPRAFSGRWLDVNGASWAEISRFEARDGIVPIETPVHARWLLLLSAED